MIPVAARPMAAWLASAVSAVGMLSLVLLLLLKKKRADLVDKPEFVDHVFS